MRHRSRIESRSTLLVGDVMRGVALVETLMPHSVSVIVTGRAGAPRIDGHYGYVAGRYRDGFFSDVWTDVSRCASGTFTAYAPACTCGWLGDIHPSTASGFHSSREALTATHLDALARLPKLATVFTPPTRVRNRPHEVCTPARPQRANA